MNGTIRARTVAYSGRETPFSRARRLASSFVTGPTYPWRRRVSAPTGRVAKTGPIDEGGGPREHSRQDHGSRQEGRRRPDGRREPASAGAPRGAQGRGEGEARRGPGAR